MKSTFLIMLSLCVWLTACMEIEIDQEINATTEEIVGNGYRSLEDALRIADKWLALTDTVTRAHKRDVENVEYIGGTSTRATSDTLLYLINYSNNEGFALIGRPTASQAIYAISEKGSLDMSDTVYNKPLAQFISSYMEDAYFAQLTPTIINTINPPDLEDINYRIYRKVNPMLPGKVSEWSQFEPYNYYCPYVDGKRGVVGCGPLALGMLLAYYQYPATIRERKVDWRAIVKDNLTIEIAILLESLASSTYLNCEYKDNKTWDNRETDPNRITKAMGNLGYAVGSAWAFEPYYLSVNGEIIDNIENTLSFMKNGYNEAKAAPLILFGESAPPYNERHIWIMDGYIQIERFNTRFPNLPGQVEAPNLHLVWGWGGKANGYFSYRKSTDMFTTIPSDELPAGYPLQYGKPRMYGRYAILSSE